MLPRRWLIYELGIVNKDGGGMKMWEERERGLNKDREREASPWFCDLNPCPPTVCKHSCIKNDHRIIAI